MAQDQGAGPTLRPTQTTDPERTDKGGKIRGGAMSNHTAIRAALAVRLSVNTDAPRAALGNEMKKLSLAFLALCACSLCYAQDRLPSELVGGVNQPGAKPSLWSVVVESQESDGTVAGKMNYSGRVCNF
jgi:hypothetical protein